MEIIAQLAATMMGLGTNHQQFPPVLLVAPGEGGESWHGTNIWSQVLEH